MKRKRNDLTNQRLALSEHEYRLSDNEVVDVPSQKDLIKELDEIELSVFGEDIFGCETQRNEAYYHPIIVGLVDADLMDGGTRHPNLALLKIAGFLHDNEIAFRLIESENEDISIYHRIYVSKVFSFTKDPKFFDRTIEEKKGDRSQFRWGGTGYYALEDNIKKFREKRIEDMTHLENDEFLNQYPNMRGGKEMGISMAHQMPYYDLYGSFIEKQIAKGKSQTYYKDYLYYSIGFLTRGCFRKCPFCVNRLEGKILPHSRIEWFLDNERDENGKLKRPYIYLWDDNFLASSPRVWRPLLKELQETGRPFQFRQGLDERIIAESPYGEEIAKTLSKCRYHGDYIFAFDNWADRDKIEKALKIWKYYNKKETKFYLFCGYKLTYGDDAKLYKDIWEIFQRIKILMQYGCLGYIMRHEDYHNHELSNIYVQIARWCNQPGFYRKMSFWEFCYKNQSFWEQRSKHLNTPDMKTYEEFERDYNAGLYDRIGLARPLKTVVRFLDNFPGHKAELIEMFSYRLYDLKNSSLWSRKEVLDE